MTTPYIRHLRNRKFSRLRHSQNTSAWLAAQATRLSTTALAIFNILSSGFSAKRVEGLSGDPDLLLFAAPAITGTVAEGNTLTKVTNGTITGLAPISYTFQWRRNGVAIEGATSATYVVPPGGAGPYTCAVTATNPAGTLTAISNALN